MYNAMLIPPCHDAHAVVGQLSPKWFHYVYGLSVTIGLLFMLAQMLQIIIH